MSPISISVVQSNTFAGKLNYNKAKIIGSLQTMQQTDLVIMQELGLCGKGLKQNLLNQSFIKDCENNFNEVLKASKDIKSHILIGSVLKQNGKLYNALFLIKQGKVLQTICKQEHCQNNYFDESSYFSLKECNSTIDIKDTKINVVIDGNIENIKNHTTDDSNLVVFVKSVPYTAENSYKQQISKQASAINKNILHINSLGFTNGVLFAGDTTLYNKTEIKELNKPFEEAIINTENKANLEQESKEKQIYNALCFGFNNFMKQNSFTKAVFGLSGGIDSAVCTTIACDCLGSENVYTYMLASEFTSEDSFKDAEELAKNLNCHYSVISIKEMVQAGVGSIKEGEKNIKLSKLALENIQSRVRANILMALANSIEGSALIATGNKSEIATGFCTLYGDTCGAIAPIGDLLKTEVYSIANFRNNNTWGSLLNKLNVIPQNIIQKAPSAELHSNQKDEDRLPPYNKLDNAIKALMETNLSKEDANKQVEDEQTIKESLELIVKNEFKRKLMANVIKVSNTSFLPTDWKF